MDKQIVFTVEECVNVDSVKITKKVNEQEIEIYNSLTPPSKSLFISSKKFDQK